MKRREDHGRGQDTAPTTTKGTPELLTRAEAIKRIALMLATGAIAVLPIEGCGGEDHYSRYNSLGYSSFYNSLYNSYSSFAYTSLGYTSLYNRYSSFYNSYASFYSSYTSFGYTSFGYTSFGYTSFGYSSFGYTSFGYLRFSQRRRDAE
jgi:hypothetical protein